MGIIKAEFVVNVLCKWWKLVVPLGLVFAAVLGATVYVNYEPAYEATAWLRIKETRPFVVVQSRDFSQSFTETQIQLLRSPLVLGTVVTQSDISGTLGNGTEEGKTHWLAKRLEVRPAGTSELVKVSLETNDPIKSERIVNSVVNAYMDLQDRDTAVHTQQVIATLEKERETRSREVAGLREKLRGLTVETGSTSAGSADSGALSRGPIDDLQTGLAEGELGCEVLKARISALDETLGSERIEVSDSRLDAAIDERAAVEGLNDQLAEKRLKLHDILATSASGEADPFYQQLSQEIKSDEVALARLREELRRHIRPDIEKEVRNELKDEHVKLRTELTARELTVEKLQQRLNSHFDEARQLSGKTLELGYGREELALAEERLDRITTRLIELRTESDAPARISLLKPATVPTTPVEWVSVEKMALVSLLGLLMPFGLALVWERARRLVADREELEQACNLSVLAEIPRLPKSGLSSGGLSNELVHRDLALFEESIDGLQACLMLSEPLKHMRVLAVTSAANQEGKTSVAAQLAVSIARATGEDTLLIDGDARSPDTHRLFEMPLEPGLSEVLSGRCTIHDAIHASRYENLHILPAGKLPTSPHRVFRRQAVQSLLDEIRSSYRYLIVDTPPVLGASEALCLAKTADVCVVCARWDVSRIDKVQAACERLFSADVCPVGIVLNGVPFKHYAYRYGRYPYAPAQASGPTMDTQIT
ncbi:MAG: polysaccharide biosynthesis tyrosine autokinase [Planctomycetes bacterium]|nr:polysaccharide biosynthesis tyrosine autokinase [Planctomycetota bacterium]